MLINTQKAEQFGIDAAEEHVALAHHLGETPSDEISMGLWQSFQAAFPKANYIGTQYDQLVSAFDNAYTQTVKKLEASEDQ